MADSFPRRKFLKGSALLGMVGALPAAAAISPSSVAAITPSAPAGENTGATARSGPIFNVKQFGALGDGARLNTQALQKAIDTAEQAGGGTVLFPPGRYLSGTILMKSHVTLHLAPGATLLGSTNLADYPPRLPAFKSYTAPYTHKYLIYGERLEDTSIQGGGTLDGQGASFERTKWDRPYLIRFSECRNVTVRDIRLINSGMWVQHYLACTDVLIDGVRVSSHVARNNDGIDIDCCERVRIANCEIDSGDDAIVLKSGGTRVTRHVAITNCVLRSSTNAIKTGTESEGGFENIVVSNCAVHETGDSGISIETVDGGPVEGIVISNVTMRGVGAPIFVRLGNRARPIEPGAPKPGVATSSKILISGVEVVDAGKTGCSIVGLPGHVVRDVTLSNIRIRFAGGGAANLASRQVPELTDQYPEANMFGLLPAYGLYCRHVEGLKLSNISTAFDHSDARPALICEDVSDFDLFGADLRTGAESLCSVLLRNVQGAMIHGCRTRGEIETYLRIEGVSSNNISLIANDLSRARKAVEFASGAPKSALYQSANRNSL